MTNPTDELLTIPEGAEILRISESTFRRMIARGAVKAYRVGFQVRLRREDVEAALRPVVEPVEK